jgi:hypothetical protein
MQFTSPTIFLATEKLAQNKIFSFEKYLLQNAKFPFCFANYNEFSIFCNSQNMTPTKFQKEIIKQLNSCYYLDAYSKKNNKHIIYSQSFPIAHLYFNSNFENMQYKLIVDYNSKSKNTRQYKDDASKYYDINFKFIEMFNDLFLKKEFWCQNVYQVNDLFLQEKNIFLKME